MSKRHGWWCRARTYPLTCKYCGTRIFHFSCDCGCSVLFEQLGRPWPLHRCLDSDSDFEIQFVPTRRDVRAVMPGTLAASLTDGDLARLSRMVGEGISREYSEDIRRAVGRQSRAPSHSQRPTLRQDAYHNCRTSERGIVRELIWDVDIFAKAGLSEQAMGASALAAWARHTLAQVTMHTGALAADEDENCSFTFLVKAADIEEAAVMKGSLVDVALRGIVLLPAFPIWVCDKLVDL